MIHCSSASAPPSAAAAAAPSPGARALARLSWLARALAAASAPLELTTPTLWSRPCCLRAGGALAPATGAAAAGPDAGRPMYSTLEVAEMRRPGVPRRAPTATSPPRPLARRVGAAASRGPLESRRDRGPRRWCCCGCCVCGVARARNLGAVEKPSPVAPAVSVAPSAPSASGEYLMMSHARGRRRVSMTRLHAQHTGLAEPRWRNTRSTHWSRNADAAAMVCDTDSGSGVAAGDSGGDGESRS